MIRHTIALDTADVANLTETGSIVTPLGSRELELHTGRPQWADSLTVEFSDEDLSRLREQGKVEFLTGFGTVVVLFLDAVAVTR